MTDIRESSERFASRERWREEHGEYPFLVLGFRDGVVRCLDCSPGGPLDTALLAGDAEGERAACSECGRPLRHATRFGDLSEADLRGSATRRDSRS